MNIPIDVMKHLGAGRPVVNFSNIDKGIITNAMNINVNSTLIWKTLKTEHYKHYKYFTTFQKNITNITIRTNNYWQRVIHQRKEKFFDQFS